MPALFTLNGALTADVIVAVGMVAAEVFILTQIVPRSGPPPAKTRMVIGSSALLGSSGVLMALLGAYLQPNLSTYSYVLMAFNFMMVGPPGLWFISLIVFEDRTIRASSWLWPAVITAMATSAEVLMGLFFTVASGGPLDVPSVLAGTLTSAWFLWSMTAAMVALLLWLPLDRSVRDPLLGLAAAGSAAPLVPVDAPLGALLMGVAMAGTLLYAFRGLRRGVGIRAEGSRVLLGVTAAFLLMSLAGAASALVPGSVDALLAFGLVMAVVMTAEFLVIVRTGLAPAAIGSPSVSGVVPALPVGAPSGEPATGTG